MRIRSGIARMFGWSLLVAPAFVVAQPARIILLRHAEKLNGQDLCDIGNQRAQALAKQFLSKGAQPSLFSAGEAPAAFLAITKHTIETITPAAQSWGQSVTSYDVSGDGDEDDPNKDTELNAQTRKAAQDVLSAPQYDGKIVVMTWEHKRIAKKKLEAAYPGQDVTLRQLLHLDSLSDVPKSWPDSNYDFFWIVDYSPGNPIPKAFTPVRQVFAAPFDKLPANGWDDPEPLHIAAGCLK
jgi:hypothetical protein